MGVGEINVEFLSIGWTRSNSTIIIVLKVIIGHFGFNSHEMLHLKWVMNEWTDPSEKNDLH